MSDLPSSYLAENDSSALLQTCITFLVIETLSIILLWTSRYLGKDHVANLSMPLLLTTGYFTCVGKITIVILMVKTGGAGRHMSSLTTPEIGHILKLQTTLQILCPLTTSLAKLGILSLLDQILGQTSRTYRLVIRSAFALILAIMLIQVIIPFANCKPFSDTWSPSVTAHESCAIPGLSLWRYLTVPNIITTILMLCIPIPALYKLQVNSITKFGLGLVFSVCMMGMVATIMRFYSFLAVTDFLDISYQCVRPLCWTVAESGIYLVSGVMPTLRKLGGKGQWNRLLERSSRGWGSIGGESKRGNQMLFRGDTPLVSGKSGVMSETSEEGLKDVDSVRTSRVDDMGRGL